MICECGRVIHPCYETVGKCENCAADEWERLGIDGATHPWEIYRTVENTPRRYDRIKHLRRKQCC